MSNLLEFFRPEHLRPVDSQGYELPEWENPYFQIPPDDAPIEPDQVDVEWLNSNPALPPISGGSPADVDPAYDEWSRELDEWYRRLEELQQASQWQDRLEAMHYVDGDEQAAAAGGGI